MDPLKDKKVFAGIESVTEIKEPDDVGMVTSAEHFQFAEEEG